MRFTDEQVLQLQELADMALDYIMPKEEKLYKEDVARQPFMKDCHIYLEILKLHQMIYTGKVSKKQLQEQLKYGV